MVDNYAYSGPSANVPQFNAKKVTRHYGFGGSPKVTIGGVTASCSGSDLSLTCTVPQGLPACPIQQQAQYANGASPAQCGQLVITNTTNGKQSVDTVTVTVGGKPPVHHVAANETIQSAIDAAMPGDLIIVDPTCTTGSGATAAVAPCSDANGNPVAGITSKAPAAHTEMLIMWKPVRLQGVGAASTIIDANTQPAGKLLDPWRRHINCLFGLALAGAPYTNTGSGASYVPGPTPYDPNSNFTCPDTGWNYFKAQPNVPQIDRLPLEAVVGWNAVLNGSLAEQLQEPTLMGAYEGAGITVLGKGLEFHGQVPWNDGFEHGGFPAATTLLIPVVSSPQTGIPVGDANPYCHTGTYDPKTGAFTQTGDTNLYPSNFSCNPSSIDGLSVTDSSQGGGGIFVHGWAH